MMKLMTFYRSRSVREKILINYIAMIILTIVILISIITYVSSKSLEETADKYTLQLVKQVNNNVEFYLKNTEDIIYYISTNQWVRDFMINGEDDTNKSHISGFLKTFEEANTEIAGLVIVNARDEMMSNNMIRRSRDALAKEEWYDNATREPEDLQLISNPLGRNIEYKNNIYSSDDVVSISKAIINEKGQVMGVVLIDFKLKVFQDMIENTEIGKNGFVFIMDKYNEVVYSPINKVVYRIKPSELEAESNMNVVTINETKYKLSWVDSKYLKLKVIGVFSLKEALQDVTDTRNIAMVISIIVIFFSSMVAIYLSDSLTKPMAELESLMRKAEEGELDVYFDSDYNDEISQLGNRFNHMIDAIKNLINLVYIEQKEKREAELNILREQIKPHFLYNTLDTIHWLIVQNQNKEADKVLKALTKLFRISLSKGHDSITIREEIMHVESYLTIQSIRYAEKFDYEIHCESHLLECHVTKLILQPIIENAIYHGIKEKPSKGLIKINIYSKDNLIYFEVWDNGIGINEDEVIRLNKVLTKSVEQSGEYGLVNVNERIRLTYGEEYGIRIESHYKFNTKVTILHPFI